MARARIFGASVIAGVLAICSPGPGLAVEAELSRLALKAVEAPVPTVAVAGSEERARRYAETIREALEFFEAELGWSLDFRLAVLDRPAWEKVSGVPWPAPFVQQAEAYIVMPNSIVDYPGFDQWSFEDRALTEVLTVHEVGHALGAANGLHSANHWIHELIADLFLAAFIRAREPSMLPLLKGPPKGFGPFRHTQFADLDYLYAGVGLLNYAWYQFELARIADRMLDEKPFAQVIGALKREPGANTPYLAARSAERVVAVTPSIGDDLAHFTGASSLPAVDAAVCSHAMRRDDGENSGLVFENASARPFAVIDWVSHDLRQGVEDGFAALEGRPAKVLPPSAVTVEPDTFMPLFGHAGQELDIGNGHCVRVGEALGRYRVQ